MGGEIWKKFHYICKKYVKQLNAKDMKKGICLTVIAAVALLVSVSCNANKSTAPESSGASKVEAVKSDFSFLKKLGIDPADSLLIADEIDAERGQMALLALDDNQRRALLKGIADDDEIDFGVFSIAGIRALPGGFTLVAYHIELGDGSGGMVAVYDRDGKVTDMALTGAWQTWEPVTMNEECTAGVMLKINNVLRMVSKNSFKVTGTTDKYSFTASLGDREVYSLADYKKTNSLMNIVKEYTYTIDGKGLMKMSTPKVLSKTGVKDVDMLIGEIDDLFSIPKNDISVCDKLNEIALRPQVMNAANDEEYGYRLQSVVMRVFSENPDGLLKWLASHRDLSKNRVVTIFESLFSEGIVDKYKLYQQIQDMPAGSDKEYLEKLTGQWGVAGAVG